MIIKKSNSPFYLFDLCTMDGAVVERGWSIDGLQSAARYKYGKCAIFVA